MEFERRSKRDIIAERKEQEEAQRSSDAIKEGAKARQAQVVEEEKARLDQEQAASTSKSATEEVLHNLNAAQHLLSTGGVSAAP
jgi:mevalonate kinase